MPGFTPTEVVPQVGAVLYLDSDLDHPDLEQGNPYWELDGSCVLVSPNQILTIRHTLTKPGIKAAFFPYEGIFLLRDGRGVEDYPVGDSVVIQWLKDGKRVEGILPLPYRKVWKRSLRSVLIGGYGSWEGVAEGDGDGLQRLEQVWLGIPDTDDAGRALHYDNLDLCWWSPWNCGRAALLNNSGGPLLQVVRAPGGNRLELVGINREVKGAQQIGSWITKDRDGLFDRFIQRLRTPEPLVTPRALEARRLVVDRDGRAEVKIPVPAGAKRVKATLNASQGLRLQMHIVAPSDPDGTADLHGTGTDPHASGRFLYRTRGLPTGTPEITVGVASVNGATASARRVGAQLCCMFL